MEKLLQRLREERAAKLKEYEALRAKYGEKAPGEWETSDRSKLTELHERLIDIEVELSINEAAARQQRFVEATTVGVDEGRAREASEVVTCQEFRQLLCATSNGQYTEARQAYLDSVRDMQVDIPAKGGYVAMPRVMLSELIEPAKRDFVIRRLARTLPSVGREGVGVPELTGRPTAAWGTELTGATATDITLGERALAPKDNVALVKISKSLLREWQSGNAMVIEELGYAKNYLEEAAFVAGDGVTCPLGLNTASANGVPSSQNVTSTVSGGFDADDLIDLALGSKIRPVYFNDPSAAYLMSSTALAQTRKLKDDEGQYICTPAAGIGDSLTKGAAFTILGKPIFVSEFMPTLATGSLSVLFGAFRHFHIVDSIHAELQILTELYAESNKNGYQLRGGADGAPVKSDAFARLVTL